MSRLPENVLQQEQVTVLRKESREDDCHPVRTVSTRLKETEKKTNNDKMLKKYFTITISTTIPSCTTH